jgi:anti-anti-sigma factor
MEIAEEKRSGVLVLAPIGRLDTNTSGSLESRLLRALAEGEASLTVDLERIDYVSSAGLRVLLMIAKRLRPPAGRLVLCGLTPAVRQTFDLAGFSALFAIEPSRDAAVAALGA